MDYEIKLIAQLVEDEGTKEENGAWEKIKPIIEKQKTADLPKAVSGYALLHDVMPLIKELKKLDCGSNSCIFAQDKSGQRTNSGCNCLKLLPIGVRIILEKIWHYFI